MIFSYFAPLVVHYIITIVNNSVQPTLGFATMDIVDNLDLAIGRALTDLRLYINSDLKLWPLYSEIATVEVVISNGIEQKLLLATTRSLYQAEIHLF